MGYLFKTAVNKLLLKTGPLLLFCANNYVNVEIWFWVPGKVCSENTTKDVLRYTSRSVTKHIILHNTPERVSNLGQARNTKVCLDNSSRCVRVTHEKVCICTHLCVCCFEDVIGLLQGTLTSLAILFPINCTEI